MVQFTEFDEKRNFEDGVPVLLDGLRIECEKVTAELAAKYNWSNTDFRVVTFHRLRNVIQSVLAARIFQYSIFPNSNFWQAFFIRVPSTDEMEDHFRELDTMIRFVAFQGIFSALESDVRELVR